ncbi:MAG: JAB domain-containing protein [Chlorobi bacterium]|nr:JAB domain-containing protein [Chlorobiota bacterium]
MAEYKNLSIKQWALEDRPREKLMVKGIQSLSDAELIAILIGSGTKETSAVSLARTILQESRNNLNELSKMSVEELCRFRGIGRAKAIAIVAALELGRRRKQMPVLEKKKITCSRDVFELFNPLLSDLPHEEFWILHLNRSNKVQARKKISQGGISGTLIDIRLVLKDALDNRSVSLILCHNHPSGNLQPSDADIKITRKIFDAAKMMDIQLLDHIIVGEDTYYSFADKNLIGTKPQ